MAIQRLVIQELYQGTSNQHPARRRPGQVEAANNIRFDAGNGATRRNGTELLLDLDLDTSKDWQLESFKGRYLVAVCPSDIRLFDMEDGSEISLINSEGDFAYLASATSRTDFRFAALLDSLIILNRKVDTAFSASAYYDVDLSVVTYDKLFDDDEAVAAPQGTYAEVLEDWKETRAGYYQKGTNDAGAIVWTMTTPPQDDNAVPNPSTLPHRIVHDVEADTFTYEPCPWLSRLSGTDATNPAPSWAGSPIDEIAGHQGRLFLIGNSYITSGEVAAPRRSVFNLYDYNVSNPQDPDRIDYAITDSRLGDCLYAEVVGPDLAMIHQNGVNVFTAGNDPLTAFNGRDFMIRKMPCSEGVRPAVSAGELFVLDDNNRIHWFLYDRGLRPFGNINDHRPDILNGETVLDLFAVGQTLFIPCESGTVKVHERYVIPEGNQLSAWSELALFEPLVFVGEWNDKIKLVCNDNGYSLLDYEHRFPILRPDFDYEICLDRIEAVTGTYDGSKDRTRFTHTGRDASLSASVLIATIDPDGNRANQGIEPIAVSRQSFYVSGDYSGQTHLIGFRYSSRLTLSKLWAGPSDQMPLLSQMNVSHVDSTDYVLETTVEGESVNLSEWSAMRMGSTFFGEVVSETGVSQHLVMGDARETTIGIWSDSPGYFQIPAIEYKLRLRGRN
jgi:hypothetical protein